VSAKPNLFELCRIAKQITESNLCVCEPKAELVQALPSKSQISVTNLLSNERKIDLDKNLIIKNIITIKKFLN
jgi:hypothetical protein